jgi:ABC-type phosphate transport system substrate-binding protein
MKTRKYIIILVIALLSTSLPSAYGQSYKIIVNKSNPATSVSKKEASDYFLKKKAKWPDGTAVTPIDLSSSSKVREEFSQQIHGKSTAAVRNFWQQAAFSGTASAPVEKPNDNEIIEFVKKNPGAIGYVSSSANTSDVKILTIN